MTILTFISSSYPTSSRANVASAATYKAVSIYFSFRQSINNQRAISSKFNKEKDKGQKPKGYISE